MNKLIETVKTNFKKNKILILIFLLVWAAIVPLTLYSYKDSLGKESIGNLEYNYVEVLSSSVDAKQEANTVDGIVSASVRLEVYKKNNNHVTIQIIGKDTGKIYGEKTLKIKNVLGASFNTIGLSEPLNSKTDKKIIIKVSTDDDSGAIGVWCSFNSPFDGNPMYIGGQFKEGAFTARLLHNSQMFSTFSNIVIGSMVVLITILILYMLLFEPKKEIIYTLLVLVFGLLFLVVITPISGPDEEYHYRMALNVSNKFLGKPDPEMIEDVYIGYYQNFECNFNIGAVYRDVIEHFNDPLIDLTGRNKYDLGRGYVYGYDICYYPQAIAITIARLLNLNFLKTFYLGRLSSLLFYTLCTYIAVKKTPILKNLLGICALIPINIQQGVCYSQDMWISSLSLVILAFFLKWKYGEEKIGKGEFLFVLAVDCLLAPTKIVYSLFMLLFWLVPQDKFFSKKHRMICLLLLMVPMFYQVGKNIFSRIMLAITYPISAEDLGTSSTHEVDVYFSIQYIVKHPMEAIAIIYRTLRAQLKSWFAGAIGRYLSGLTLILPSRLSHCILIILVAASLIFEQKRIEVPDKILFVMICAAIGGLTLAALLTGWTDVKDEYIQGIQGRYFSPLLPYLFMILNNSKVYIPQKADKLIIYSEMLLLFEIIIYILSYTFVY